MQSISANLLAAAHSLNRQPFAQILVDDPRIRGWRRTDSVSTGNGQFDARLTNNSKIVRAYNDSSANPGVLHIALATIGATPTFADVSIGTVNLRQDSGVALFNDPTDSSPNRIDCFYIDNTSGTPVLKNLTSATNGTSWSAGTFSKNMKDPQIARVNTNHGSQPQLACAGWLGNGGSYAPYLFYTSASSNTTDPDPPNLVFYDASADTHNRCWLDFIDTDVLNTNPPASCIGAFQLNSTDFACVLSISNVRGTKNSGIYLIWYRDSIWSEPYEIWTRQDVLIGNSTYEISFPRLQIINGNYWITATQTITIPGLSVNSAADNKQTSHLIGFYSSDAVHWSAPVYLAGMGDIGNGYWTSAPASATTVYDSAFALNDFLMGKLLVSTTRTFMVGYGRLFQLNGGTPSIFSSTASDYAANTLDITGDVADFTVTQPNGSAAQLQLSLQNPSQTYNNSNILRRGSRVIVKAGYKTASNDATDLATLTTARIDEPRQMVTLGQNEITLAGRDEASKKLEDWTSDNYLEYSSGQHVAAPQLMDYGSTIQVQGTWLLSNPAGSLTAQQTPLDIDGTPLLAPNFDILIANTGRNADGLFDAQFSFANLIQNAYAGIVFRYQNNKNFYYLVFNYPNASGIPTNGWDLLEFSHSTTGVSLLSAPITTANVKPTVNQVWWVRVHIFENQIVCSARQEGDTQWHTILSKTSGGGSDLATNKRIRTDTGYFGFAAQSLGLLVAGAENGTTSKVYSNTGEYYAQSFFAPTFKGSPTCRVTSLAAVLKVKGVPGGTITFYIVQDDGTGTKPVTLSNQAASLTGANTTIQTASVKPKKNWTTATVNASDPVYLKAGTRYWLVVAPSPNILDPNNNLDFYYNTDVNVIGNGVSDGGTGGASWFVQSNVKFVYAVNVVGAGGAVTLSGYTLYSQDEPKTLGYLVDEVATKALVTTTRQNYVLNDAGTALTNFDTGGQRSGWGNITSQIAGYNSIGSTAYGYLRSTVQTFHEAVVEFDMTLGAAGHLCAAGILLCQQNSSTLTSDANLKCFEVEFNLDNGVVIIYALNGAAPSAGNRIFSAKPLIDLQAGKQYRVKIQHSGKFIVVYLNGVVVAGVKTNSVAGVDTSPLNPAGYFGLVTFSDNTRNSTTNFAAKFDNLKIQELKEVVDYFVVESAQTGMQALNNLLKNERVKVYGDYDGALRYAYFDNQTASGDSAYTTTIVKATKGQSDRDWASHNRPFGDYHADRYSSYLLDQEGLRFKQLEYTDAKSDRGAYHAGAYPIRSMRENLDTLEFTCAANPALQREDRITVQVDALGVNGDYLVDSITFRYVAGDINTQPIFDMDVVCRRFVNVSAEGAA